MKCSKVGQASLFCATVGFLTHLTQFSNSGCVSRLTRGLYYYFQRVYYTENLFAKHEEEKDF